MTNEDRRAFNPLESTPVPIPVPRSSSKTPTRRIIWMAYALPLTLIVAPALGLSLVDTSDPLGILDAVFAVPWLAALYLHIWDKKTATPGVWRGYAFAYVAWSPLYLLVLDPAMTGTQPEFGYLLLLVLFAPAFIALFRYAFRDWSTSGSL